MTPAAPSQVAASRYEQVCSVEQASSFSPSEIREAIGHWVAQDRLDIADALLAAGLGLYPRSQDILAIGALLCEVNQDWAQAQDCLERLVAVQGEAVTAETWYHLVRVMRCRSAHYNAFVQVRMALEKFPDHPGLQATHAELNALLEPVLVQPKVEAQVA